MQDVLPTCRVPSPCSWSVLQSRGPPVKEASTQLWPLALCELKLRKHANIFLARGQRRCRERKWTKCEHANPPQCPDEHHTSLPFSKLYCEQIFKTYARVNLSKYLIDVYSWDVSRLLRRWCQWHLTFNVLIKFLEENFQERAPLICRCQSNLIRCQSNLSRWKRGRIQLQRFPDGKCVEGASGASTIPPKEKLFLKGFP